MNPFRMKQLWIALILFLIGGPLLFAASMPLAQESLTTDASGRRVETKTLTQTKDSENRFSLVSSIMVRGVFGALTTPLEFIYTPMAERKEYPRLWPVTSLTRTATNIFYRLSSAVYDIAFYPLVVPFVDETPPLTEKMGLSADVWEMENEY